MISFLDLPGELRNMIYKQLLTLKDPIEPLFGGQNLLLDSAILCTNRSINRESSPILYAQNCFDFAGWDEGLISGFLGQIGCVNAGYIQDIRIDFPRIRDIDDNVTVEDDSALFIGRIEADCINLRSITMDSVTNDMEVKLDGFDSPELVNKALSFVNTRLRAFPRLERIIIEVYDDNPSSYIRKEMDRLGWVISTVEPIEDWDDDRHFSDFEEDDYLDFRDDYLDFREDDYDIDNDSDFWRRAAD